MSTKKRDLGDLEIFICGATVLLSTLSYLFGSPKLAVISLVVGGISFGIILGARNASLGTSAQSTGGQGDKTEPPDEN